MDIRAILTIVAIVLAAAIALTCDLVRTRQMRRKQMRKARPSMEPAAESAVAPIVKRSLLEPPCDLQPAVTEGRRPDEEKAVASKKALSDWLVQRAVARAGEMAASENPPPATTTAPPVRRPVRLLEGPIEPVVIDLRLLDALMGDEEPRCANGRPVLRLIQGSAHPASTLVVPPGFWEDIDLDRLLANSKPFRGLVVVLAVEQIEPKSSRSDEVWRSIETFVAGLLGPEDFGCRKSFDDFVIVSPGTMGLESEKLVTGWSERLWNFQLRVLSTSSLIFSMGTAEAECEPLAEALAAAKERMNETRKNRKLVNLPGIAERKRAVS